MTASSDLADHLPSPRALTPVLRGPRRAGAEVTDLAAVRADRVAADRIRREADRTRELTALLQERPDLEGVHAHADFAVTYLHWCV